MGWKEYLAIGLIGIAGCSAAGNSGNVSIPARDLLYPMYGAGEIYREPWPVTDRPEWETEKVYRSRRIIREYYPGWGETSVSTTKVKKINQD